MLRRTLLSMLACALACASGCQSLTGANSTKLETKCNEDVACAKTAEERTIQAMRDIIIPEMSFRPPATLVDVLDFLKQATRDYADENTPVDKRGVSVVLKLPPPQNDSGTNKVDSCDPPTRIPATSDIPVIAAFDAKFISLYDAFSLICDMTGYKFRIRNGTVMIVPGNEPDGELVTHRFDLRRRQGAGCGHPDHYCPEDAHARNAITHWKDLFEIYGVTWPTGSSVVYDDVLNYLTVVNTQENIDIIKAVWNDTRMQFIRTEFDVFAFRAKDIARLNADGGMSLPALRMLQKKGKAKPVASASVVTRSGQEAIMKSVKEILYPTQLAEAESADTTGGAAGLVVKPHELEMRETGIILQVIPESQVDGRIAYMINPQWVTLEGWESFDAGLSSRWGVKKIPLKQPIFCCTSWQTQFVMKNDETVLIGTATTPDGKWVHAAFLRASIVPHELQRKEDE